MFITIAITIICLYFMLRPSYTSSNYDFGIILRFFWLIPISFVWAVYFAFGWLSSVHN